MGFVQRGKVVFYVHKAIFAPTGIPSHPRLIFVSSAFDYENKSLGVSWASTQEMPMTSASRLALTVTKIKFLFTLSLLVQTIK